LCRIDDGAWRSEEEIAARAPAFIARVDVIELTRPSTRVATGPLDEPRRQHARLQIDVTDPRWIAHLAPGLAFATRASDEPPGPLANLPYPGGPSRFLAQIETQQRVLEAGDDQLVAIVDQALRDNAALRLCHEVAPPSPWTVYVALDEGRPAFALAPRAMPWLAVREEVMAEAVASLEPTRVAQVKDAQWLIGGIEARACSLCNLAGALLREAPAVVDASWRPSSPIDGAAVATELAVHPSTVRRLLANKYLGRAGGLIALADLCTAPSHDESVS
jgi:hypothetical protein